MAAATQTQAVIQRATTVFAPMTLGFVDCVVLLLSFLLMLMAALYPNAPSAVRED